jgi:release factor glutamine methyltransferase
MNITQALKDAHKRLIEAGFDRHDSLADAEILLAHVIEQPRQYIMTHPDGDITAHQFNDFIRLIKERIKHIPVSYLTGYKEFYGLEFLVNKNVLTPRPETEILIDAVLQTIKEFNHYVTIADIGTGSGCIPIAILNNSQHIFRMYASDISRKALKVAKQNAERYEEMIQDRLTFHRGNLIKPLKMVPLDMVIANLPYLSIDEYRERPELHQEPQIALTDKDDGLSLYRELFEQIRDRAQTPFYIFLEIGTAQADAISKLAHDYLEVKKIDILKDLAGHDRVLKIHLH